MTIKPSANSAGVLHYQIKSNFICVAPVHNKVVSCHLSNRIGLHYILYYLQIINSDPPFPHEQALANRDKEKLLSTGKKTEYRGHRN